MSVHARIPVWSRHARNSPVATKSRKGWAIPVNSSGAENGASKPGKSGGKPLIYP